MVKRKNESWEWLKALVIALVIAAGIRYFLFAPIVVDGESMMPTLHNGDRMIVNKFSYEVGEPDRFDIVVFHAPEGKDYIKRIIGLPGDKIEYKDDTLYVNDKEIPEPYLNEYKQSLSGGNLTYNFDLSDEIGSQTVPENHVFVLGDNRQHSKDSRNIGSVPMDEIIGKANVIFWPVAHFEVLK
ncbi:signal peptidase I [Pseudalkalibacillus salsuginis]|uniref:signal peptidase I n=1 Tax=Pseudalkalibacillus salsuginis TaxID=2910972 RepID=UPI001F360B45|nr:signal peptidase I [Pseudalkalibacillus salsuginis]MCF6410546.1 signal peptidase I [Pseudalkalibacillus salsuginis]